MTNEELQAKQAEAVREAMRDIKRVVYIDKLAEDAVTAMLNVLFIRGRIAGAAKINDIISDVFTHADTLSSDEPKGEQS